MASPPFTIQLCDRRGNAKALVVTVSIAAAQRVFAEAKPNLRVGEVIRVRDASGAVVLASDDN